MLSPAFQSIFADSKTLVDGYALRDGRLIGVNDLSPSEYGKACYCFCPYCGEPVIAKLGTKNKWHFAHISSPGNSVIAKQKRCFETKMHICAKEVIAELGGCWIPDIVINASHALAPSQVLSVRDYRGLTVQEAAINLDEASKLFSGRFVKGTVKLETAVGSYIPDIILTTENGEQFIIEIDVWHSVQIEKRNNMISNQLSCVEYRFRKLWHKICTHFGGQDKVPPDVLYNFLSSLFTSGPASTQSHFVLSYGGTSSNVKELFRWVSFSDKQKEIARQFYLDSIGEAYSTKNRVLRHQQMYEKVVKTYAEQTSTDIELKYKDNVSAIKGNKFFSVYPFLLKYIQVPMNGEFVFHVPREIWQGTLLLSILKYLAASSAACSLEDFYVFSNRCMEFVDNNLSYSDQFWRDLGYIDAFDYANFVCREYIDYLGNAIFDEASVNVKFNQATLVRLNNFYLKSGVPDSVKREVVFA